MADTINAQRRSENMRRIRSEDTLPELIVRKIVYGLGVHYRLHRKELPGHPDLVFASRKKIIFVHGCFWHQHEACSGGRRPRSRNEYWDNKLRRNVERDRKNIARLKEMGWDTLTIWECELASADAIRKCTETLRTYLQVSKHQTSITPP